MLNIIVGENNSGKSRYLRQEYRTNCLNNKVTKVKWAIEDPKYFIESKFKLTNNEIWSIYNKDKFTKSIYFNNNRRHKLSNNLKKVEKSSFGFKGLSRGLNIVIDEFVDVSKDDYILKILNIIFEKSDEITYKHFISEIFEFQKEIEESFKTAYFVPTIRNIEFNKEITENINSIHYIKEYNLYSENVKDFTNRMLYIFEEFSKDSGTEHIEILNEELKFFNIEISQSDDYNFFELHINDEKIKYYQLGDGYIQLINIISEIVEIKKNNTSSVIYIDEFNTSFHPQLSHQLLSYCLESDIDFTMTIHSVDFLEKEIAGDSNVNLFKVKDKDNLTIEPITYWEAYNLMDIESIKSSQKNIIFTESEVDAGLYSKFAEILGLKNCEFMGLRGIDEIPKALDKINMPHVYGLIDADDNDFKPAIKEYINEKKIFVYNEMYTIENIIYNPVNVKDVLGLNLEKCEKIKNHLLDKKKSIKYNNTQISNNMYFFEREYAKYLKESNCEIFVAHCYNNKKLDFLKRDKTMLKLKTRKMITKKENFPDEFIEMIEEIDSKGV